MAFCPPCGSRLTDGASFCSSCGARLGASAAGGGVAVQTAPPLEYAIEGDNRQIARIQLKPSQELYPEAGKKV